MSQRIVIDSLVFAREARSLQGELPIAEFPRIQDMLADSAGIVTYRVGGSMNTERNRPQIFLQIDGILSVCCQR